MGAARGYLAPVLIYLAVAGGLLLSAFLAVQAVLAPVPVQETTGATAATRPMTKLELWRASKIEQQIHMQSLNRTPAPPPPAISGYQVPPYAAMAKKAAREKFGPAWTKRRDGFHARTQPDAPEPAAAPMQATVDRQLIGR